MNSNLIYRELCNWNLKSNDKDQYGQGIIVEKYFEMWREHFKNIKNINAFRSDNWRYFFQFTNGDLLEDTSYIKLYIPIDSEHLYEGINELFEFMAENDIKHLSKVALKERSDNVVVRLRKDDYASLNKIVSFVSNNQYIKSGLNKTNPFLPNVKGIGIMEETGISYNSELCEIICKYVKDLKNKNINYPNINEFSEYIKKYSQHSEVNETFNIACGNLVSIKNTINDDQKKNLLLETVRATYLKYGINQVRVALNNAINNNFYGYFTNGNTSVHYRDELMKNVSSSEIKNILENILSYYEIRIGNTTMNIERFCSLITSEFSIKKFNNACLVTLNKYGRHHLKTAVTEYIRTGRADYFSRFNGNDTKTNYRDVIASIPNTMVTQYMVNFLNSKGLQNSNNFSEILDNYVNNLNNNIIINQNSSQKLI